MGVGLAKSEQRLGEERSKRLSSLPWCARCCRAWFSAGRPAYAVWRFVGIGRGWCRRADSVGVLL